MTNLLTAQEHHQNAPELLLAAQITRGVQRCLRALDYACLTEVPLANGRRADVLAVGRTGDVLIIEVKSGLADFRSDQKWPDYRDYCDKFYFAVAADFPLDVLPADAGLLMADSYGGEIVRETQAHPLSAARRRALTLQVARLGLLRLNAKIDPGLSLEIVRTE